MTTRTTANCRSRTWRTPIDEGEKFFTGMKHLKLNSDCITQDSVKQFTRHKITRVCENLVTLQMTTICISWSFLFAVPSTPKMCFYLKIEIQ
ncbi:hypothetical protein T10_4617 [Trichinella papuae]|uniref:Uncharacterized protein n=1 Tax=Trichinella papuae TaxID=268474 RepID=A0A0V1MHU4_9BILA|nr:hypothetical protein T10_4617 [Trichinella papuae]